MDRITLFVEDAERDTKYDVLIYKGGNAGMTEYERELMIAEMTEELEERKRFKEFYTHIPTLIKKHKTKESHLPLIYITSADGKYK